MADIGHSVLLKHFIGTRSKMSQESKDIESKVPDEQELRESSINSGSSKEIDINKDENAIANDDTYSPVIKITKEETSLTKGELKLQKVIVTEDISDQSTVVQKTFTASKATGPNVVRSEICTEVNISSGFDDRHNNNEGVKTSEDEHKDLKKTTKIPKFKLKQAVDKIKKEERMQEIAIHEPSLGGRIRSAIPRLKESKLQNSEKVSKNDENQGDESPKLDDEFDKIYEEIIENDAYNNNITTPEKIVQQEKLESTFEDIIHAYEEKKVKSKIPMLKRKSEHEIEVPPQIYRRRSLRKSMSSEDATGKIPLTTAIDKTIKTRLGKTTVSNNKSSESHSVVKSETTSETLTSESVSTVTKSTTRVSTIEKVNISAKEHVKIEQINNNEVSKLKETSKCKIPVALYTKEKVETKLSSSSESSQDLNEKSKTINKSVESNKEAVHTITSKIESETTSTQKLDTECYTAENTTSKIPNDSTKVTEISHVDITTENHVTNQIKETVTVGTHKYDTSFGLESKIVTGQNTVSNKDIISSSGVSTKDSVTTITSNDIKTQSSTKENSFKSNTTKVNIENNENSQSNFTSAGITTVESLESNNDNITSATVSGETIIKAANAQSESNDIKVTINTKNTYVNTENPAVKVKEDSTSIIKDDSNTSGTFDIKANKVSDEIISAEKESIENNSEIIASGVTDNIRIKAELPKERSFKYNTNKLKTENNGNLQSNFASTEIATVESSESNKDAITNAKVFYETNIKVTNSQSESNDTKVTIGRKTIYKDMETSKSKEESTSIIKDDSNTSGIYDIKETTVSGKIVDSNIENVSIENVSKIVVSTVTDTVSIKTESQKENSIKGDTNIVNMESSEDLQNNITSAEITTVKSLVSNKDAIINAAVSQETYIRTVSSQSELNDINVNISTINTSKDTKKLEFEAKDEKTSVIKDDSSISGTNNLNEAATTDKAVDSTTVNVSIENDSKTVTSNLSTQIKNMDDLEEEDIIILKGKVSRIINRLDSRDQTTNKTEVDDVPKNVCVTSKIAIFEKTDLSDIHNNDDDDDSKVIVNDDKPIIVEELLKTTNELDLNIKKENITDDITNNNYTKQLNVDTIDKIYSDKNTTFQSDYYKIYNKVHGSIVNRLNSIETKFKHIETEPIDTNIESSKIEINENKYENINDFKIAKGNELKIFNDKSVDDEVFKRNTSQIDIYKEYRLNKDLDEDRRAKSLAELDIGDAVKGRVRQMVYRMNSMERLRLLRSDTVDRREKLNKVSITNRVAMFEKKSTQIRAESSINRSVKSIASLVPTLTEEQLLDKINELSNAKMKYGRFENITTLGLRDGSTIPVLAVGTALLEPRLIKYIVSAAIDLGYRAIDTAYIYGNEKQVGEAIRTKIEDGTVKREDLYIISKLWSTYHRRDLVEKACKQSLQAMGLDYFDLYMIHNPMSFKEGGNSLPKIANVLQYSQHDYLEAWYGIEDVIRKGLARRGGVSNFNSLQIERVVDKGKIKPVINQVECHPYLTQQRLDDFCGIRNVKLSCFGVLGSKGTPTDLKSGLPPAIDDPLVKVMSAGLGITPAQLLIAYQLQSGRHVVVKSSSASHLWDNLQALAVKLDQSHLSALNALNRNKRTFTFIGMGDTHRNYPFKIAF